MYSVCSVYKNAGELRAPSQNNPVSFLSDISKIFEAIINKKVVYNLNRNRFLSDKQYVLHSFKSTADVLMSITHRISEALDNKDILRAIALDISKAFHKVWH